MKNYYPPMEAVRFAVSTVLLVVCMVSCGPVAPKRSTPQATTESYWTAMYEEDWETAFVCLLPEQRLMQLGATIGGGIFAALEKDKEEPFEALLKKHGLTVEDLLERNHRNRSKEILAQVDDPAAFYSDLMNWLATIPGSEAAEFVEEVRKARRELKITNVEIEGDTATVHHHTLKDDGGTGPSGLTVVKKQGDKWYIDMAESKDKGREARIEEIMEKYRPSDPSDRQEEKK